MHILLIHQAFVGLDEAGGTRHIEMARYLAAHGHNVTVITGTTSYLTGVARSTAAVSTDKKEEIPGITVIHTWCYAALHRGFFSRLVSFFSFMFSSFLAGLRVRKVDVVWGTSPPIFQSFTAWLLAFIKRKPFLFEVRDLWPAFAIAMGVLDNPVLISLSLWLERFLYRRANQVVVNSPGFIEHVRGKGAQNIELVPNGVDVSMFQSDMDIHKKRQELGLDQKFVALYAGAHGPSNDLDVILEAAAILQKDYLIHFLLVGDGKEKIRLQSKAIQKGLRNITFLPPVKKNEMKTILACADVCIAILKPLELYKTTYPNKVFDYMAACKPVVLAIDGVIREVVENASAGLFSPPGDAIALADAVSKLSKEPEMVDQMGLAGREYVQTHFNRSMLSAQFEQILLRMLAKRNQ